MQQLSNFLRSYNHDFALKFQESQSNSSLHN